MADTDTSASTEKLPDLTVGASRLRDLRFYSPEVIQAFLGLGPIDERVAAMQRQLAQAQQLRAAANMPYTADTGRFIANVGPWAALSNVANIYAGQRLQQQSETQLADLAQQIMQRKGVGYNALMQQVQAEADRRQAAQEAAKASAPTSVASTQPTAVTPMPGPGAGPPIRQDVSTRPILAQTSLTPAIGAGMAAAGTGARSIPQPYAPTTVGGLNLNPPLTGGFGGNAPNVPWSPQAQPNPPGAPIPIVTQPPSLGNPGMPSTITQWPATQYNPQSASRPMPYTPSPWDYPYFSAP